MTDCFTPVQGRRIRLTKLDNCGRPIYGDCAQVTSKGFVQVELSAQTEDNEVEGTTTAGGEVCSPSSSNTELTHYELNISFCQVDPDLILAMYPHWEPHVNDDGERVGWHQIGGLPSNGFALELWTDIQTQAGDPCAGGGGAGQGAWGYLLLPWVMGQAPGDLTIENAPVDFEFTGVTKRGSGWGRGPYLVEIVDGRPQRLRKPVKPKTDLVIFKTGVRPPDALCGCQPVDRPTPDPADIYIEGVSGETPRRTVRLRADNHGFGPVTIDWGDDSNTTDARDGQWVTHQYPAPSQNPPDTYTITVRDKQTPVVAATRDIQIPLPPDNPELDVAAVEGNDMAAELTWDNHGNGTVSIDWGDGTDVLTEQADAGSLTHEYTYPGLYTITVWDERQTTHRSRTAVSMPTAPPPTITATKNAEDPDGLTFDLTIEAQAGSGPVTVTWGDGTTQDGPESGNLQHVYDEAGEYTITVTSKADPLSKASTTVTAGSA